VELLVDCTKAKDSGSACALPFFHKIIQFLRAHLMARPNKATAFKKSLGNEGEKHI
jgi:hypothetical protein